MMGKTEERLRDTVTVLGGTYHSENVPPLRLTPAPGRPLGRHPFWRRGMRRWLVPVAAAASVSLVIAAVVVARSLPAKPAAHGFGPPRFLITTIDGQAAIRSGISGKIVAAIPRPAGIAAYAGVAAAGGDTTYILAGAFASDSVWKVAFFRIALSAAGRPGTPQRLPGRPVAVPAPGGSTQPPVRGWVNFDFAVPADGSELAFVSSSPSRHIAGTTLAGFSDHIVVQDVATGSRQVWKAAGAGISQLSWGPAGQLGYDLVLPNAGVSHRRLVRVAGSGVWALMVLDTAAPGSDLLRSSRVVGYRSSRAGSRDGVAYGGVISPDGKRAYVQIVRLPGEQHDGWQIAEVSAATGRTIRVLSRSPLISLIPLSTVNRDPVSFDHTGRYLLFRLDLLGPVVGLPKDPYVAGHLARLDLRTGRVTQLSIPVISQAGGALDAAW